MADALTRATDDAGCEPERALLSAKALSVERDGRSLLSKIDLAICAGEIVTLIGPNGAGKTTLVRALLGLMERSAGTIERQRDLTIGYVPQLFALDDTLPMTVGRFLALCAPQARDRVGAALAEVGIAELQTRPLQSISGGETKRVLLAQALLRDPDLLVLDEPSAGVDISGQGELYRLIRRIRDRRGCGILMVSHDLHLVMAATDRVVCLNHHVCCSGQPEAVSQHPEYIALFGPELSRGLAVYTHHHDHHHDLAGEPIGDDDHDGCGGAHHHG